MLTYSILFITILYYKNKLYINKLIYIYTSRALINESILIWANSWVLIESNRVYTSLILCSWVTHLIIDSSTSRVYSSKLMSSSTILHPYFHAFPPGYHNTKADTKSVLFILSKTVESYIYLWNCGNP
jgi:hypothetical protein